MSTVTKVRENSTRSVVEHPHSRAFGDILKRPIAAVAVEPIRQTSWLTDIKIVESVIVKIAGGYSIVTVDIDATGAIKNGSPVIGAVQELRIVGVGGTQCMLSDIDKSR